ncbi:MULTISPECIES: VOC family protein [unclassified Psychrobacter]|uniref:VOC family protein n=1 Tax=unclassified Psychrobacter TaxID=196806 RepID=UPI00078EED31|nr:MULTISPECIES: VOC family protein [unclassified Psychrobacter]AMN49338.1 glyoxalase [Psychrobacter sp. P2G3]AMN67177.1 glyoxalase [Psychrobacter sp. P11G5]
MSFKIEQIHHVAYRCKDAKETVEWYKKHLNMDFILAFAEDHVPSTKAFDPYMHIFLDAGNGNVLAFFELPNQPEMGSDPNTPDWVQHLAMKVKDRDTLMAAKKHLEDGGIDVIGVTNHGIFHSIYFFDPNGHRMELTYDDITSEEKVSMITEEIKHDMLEEWSRTKRAPAHTHFLHAEELKEAKEQVPVGE